MCYHSVPFDDLQRLAKHCKADPDFDLLLLAIGVSA